MNEREIAELRALAFTERQAVYAQAAMWLATHKGRGNGNGQQVGAVGAHDWARAMLRNIEATYRTCTSREDVLRVLGMEQTLVQMLAIWHNALVSPDGFDYETLFVPHVGQGEG